MRAGTPSPHIREAMAESVYARACACVWGGVYRYVLVVVREPIETVDTVVLSGSIASSGGTGATCSPGSVHARVCPIPAVSTARALPAQPRKERLGGTTLPIGKTELGRTEHRSPAIPLPAAR